MEIQELRRKEKELESKIGTTIKGLMQEFFEETEVEIEKVSFDINSIGIIDKFISLSIKVTLVI